MYQYLKRFLDFIIALLCCILFLVPIIIIAICIKIDSKGPILFKQARTGKNGKSFMLYKFRSMIKDNDVHDFTCGDQHTRVGIFLRKFSLDELPQIINILKGEMSFIGPRPWIPDYYENMTEEQKHRYDVLPGVSGLAQIKGRNNISIINKIKYDLAYVKNYSFCQDIKIIFLTIKTALSKEGVEAGKGTIQLELEMLKAHKAEVTIKNKKAILPIEKDAYKDHIKI